MGNSQYKKDEQTERFRSQKAADDLKVEEQITKREEQIHVTKREEEVTKRVEAIEATKREQEITKRQLAPLQLEQQRGWERRYPPSYNEDNDKLNKD